MATLATTRRDAELDHLAYEVARNEAGPKLPVRKLLDALGVDEATFVELARSALFKRTVKQYKKEIEDNGLSFQMKARVAAEDSIPIAYQIVHDKEEVASTRLKALNDLVRWAGLEPKNNPTGDGQAAPTFSINFNLPAMPGIDPNNIPQVVRGATIEHDSGDTADE